MSTETNHPPQPLGAFAPGTKVRLTALVDCHRYRTSETEVLFRTVLGDLGYRAVWLPVTLESSPGSVVELEASVEWRDQTSVQLALIDPHGAEDSVRLRWYVEAVAA